MGLNDRLTNIARAIRGDPVIGFDEWVGWMTYGNNIYTYAQGINQTLTGKTEEIDTSYAGYTRAAYKSNGIVFACMLARMMLFSEARLMFRKIASDGRPGELYGTTDGRNPGSSELGLLNQPWPNATMGDLLMRAIQDVDLAGNFYAARRPSRIKRMRPDWVSVVLGSEDPRANLDGRDLDAEVIGYVYHPGGRNSGIKAVPLMASEVAHFAPIPDPEANFIGMSWITPIVREIMGDSAARDHKLRFFENGATPNMVVQIDKDAKPSQSVQAFTEWVEAFKEKEPKGRDQYKTLYLAGGTTVDVVGKDLQQMEFKVTQGAGETRIAAASGMHPTLIGLSEGMQGSSLNSGNFSAARRLTGDKTIRPLWRNFAGSMTSIVRVPAGSELWYDDRDVPFLAEDVKDRADVVQKRAATMVSLINGGFEADDVVLAVEAEDLSLLKGKHTGLTSVQLQPPIDPDEEPLDLGVLDPPAPKQIEPPRAEAPVLNIYNEFPEGFVRTETVVNVPEQPAPVTNVTLPEQPAPVVNINEGALRATVEAPPPAQVNVNVEAQEPPVVNIAEGAIRATVEAPPPAEVTVNIPETEPPVVNVTLPEQKPVKRTVERDDDGRIRSVTEVPEE
jgi:phage portal protein BeeE